MEPCFTQLRGQAKSHPACTHRSGPLPASLASATCPLLRGTLESAGASCALTGTRGTGWSAAKHARERTCAGSSACSPHARESRSASGGTTAGQDPAIIEQSHGNEVSAVTIEHGRWHTTTHTSCPQCKSPVCSLPKGLMKMSESTRGTLWQDSQQGSHHAATSGAREQSCAADRVRSEPGDRGFSLRDVGLHCLPMRRDPRPVVHNR